MSIYCFQALYPAIAACPLPACPLQRLIRKGQDAWLMRWDQKGGMLDHGQQQKCYLGKCNRKQQILLRHHQKSHMFLRHRLQILLRHQKNKPLLLSQIQQTTHTKCYVSTKHILPGFFQIRQCNMKMLPRHLFLTSGCSALLFCGTVSSLVRATAVFATVISVIFSRYLSLSSSRTWSRRIWPQQPASHNRGPINSMSARRKMIKYAVKQLDILGCTILPQPISLFNLAGVCKGAPRKCRRKGPCMPLPILSQSTKP